MKGIVCPVCGEKLFLSDKGAICNQNHSFDRAKQGYLNLYITQKSSEKRHGDDKMMLQARKNFLEKGYYEKLAQEVAGLISRYAPDESLILDSGCGEGYYTEYVYESMKSSGKTCTLIAADISKEAAKSVCRRAFSGVAIVASAYNLPMESGSTDVILNIFSPLADKEFRRVLKPGGLLLRVVPKEKHLWELKEKIYKIPRENPPVDSHLDGFRTLQFISLDYPLELRNSNDVDCLYKMTPYYYKSSVEEQERARRLTYLNTSISFAVLLDEKIE